jgi:hypothetical protein
LRTAAEQISSTSSGGTGDVPAAAPVTTGNSIIQRKASLSQEQKLVRQIDEHNIHPLAQRAGTIAARRVASHSHALHMLAEQVSLPSLLCKFLQKNRLSCSKPRLTTV